MAATLIVSLTGDIDVYNASTVCRVLDEIDGPAVVDVSGVRLLSAAGLSELARLARRVGVGRVTLAGASVQVRRVLTIARFETMFMID